VPITVVVAEEGTVASIPILVNRFLFFIFFSPVLDGLLFFRIYFILVYPYGESLSRWISEMILHRVDNSSVLCHFMDGQA
jgi:hypothetical protein